MQTQRLKGRPLNMASILFGLVLISFPIFVHSSSLREQPADYSRWKVLEVHLGEDQTSSMLESLRDKEFPGYLEILELHREKEVAEVAVSPMAFEDLRLLERSNELTFTTVLQDLQKKLEVDGPSLRTSPLARGSVTYDRFMDVNEIFAFVEDLPKQYPDLVSLKTVGYSGENRPLYLLTITSDVKQHNYKPIIFIDGGIHAREWISPAATMNVIENLIASPSLTREVEWQIMPLLNPDGYAYSWTHDRLWRKNRATNQRSSCRGTDLNRNFGFHWAETGSSYRECSSIFHGPSSFSEPESKALKKAMQAVSDRIEAYITIHSYGQYILYPWGYTAQRDRYNEDQLYSVGSGMAKAIKNNDGTIFSVGSAAKLLYPAAGASDDWAAGELKIPLVYTLELRDNGAAGFVLPEHLILPAVNDAWLSIKYLARQLMKKEGLRLQPDRATRLPSKNQKPLESTIAEIDDSEETQTESFVAKPLVQHRTRPTTQSVVDNSNKPFVSQKTQPEISVLPQQSPSAFQRFVSSQRRPSISQRTQADTFVSSQRNPPVLQRTQAETFVSLQQKPSVSTQTETFVSLQQKPSVSTQTETAVSSQQKPPVSQRTQPVIFVQRQRKPIRRPSSTQRRTSFTQSRPSFSQGRPSFSQRRPSFSQRRPSFSQRRRQSRPRPVNRRRFTNRYQDSSSSSSSEEYDHSSEESRSYEDSDEDKK